MCKAQKTRDLPAFFDILSPRMKWRIVRRRRKRRTSVTKHYLEHKEAARKLVHEKLEYWNQFYGFAYNRVAIRNTRRCWGSCTSLKNLNFSYKLLFLPPHLQDYIIVHELCHLKELHHKESFWALLAEQIPAYEASITELKHLEKTNSFVS
jgi:predicted metal-dependent hydrolase